MEPSRFSIDARPEHNTVNLFTVRYTIVVTITESGKRYLGGFIKDECYHRKETFGEED